MKLYVGNLNYTMKENDLQDLFSQVGAVTSVTIIKDKMSGRSKGFGFVEMENDEEAKKAMEMFNGQDIEGRKLVVNEARPMEKRSFDRPRGGGGYGGGSGGYRGGSRGGSY